MDAGGIAARAVRAAYLEAVRRYHRLDITIEEPVPHTPCLIVANHGFGGIFDLNIYATLAALEAATTRPVSALTHQMAWTFGVGGAVEQVGAIPAGRQSALDALARGEHVLVFPGGDYDAAKPWCRRNEVVFHGRTRFAQLALDADVPIVPVVTAGAGESLLGLVAVMPYLPAPTKLNTVVIPAVRPGPGQQREQLAAAVHDVMQSTLTRITDDRVPVLGSQVARLLGSRA